MVRILPFPIDVVRTIDEMVDGLAEYEVVDALNRLDYLFDFKHVGFRGSSIDEARKADAIAKAAPGESVYEYARILNRSSNVEAEAARKGRNGFFGFVVASSEEELRNRLAVYTVMTS